MWKKACKTLLIKYLSVFIGVTLVLFIIEKLIPSSYIYADYNSLSSANNILGLNKPLFIQYFYFIYDLITLRLGNTSNLIYSGSTHTGIMEMLPETLFLIILAFIVILVISYKIGFFLGFRSMKDQRLDINIFPVTVLYFILPIVFIGILSGVYRILPYRYIMPEYYAAKYSWVIYANNGIIITRPTDIILFDAIIHGSLGFLYYYLLRFVMPFVSIIIPVALYLTIFIKRLTTIEYKKKYVRIRILKNVDDDNFIYHIKRNIRYIMLHEYKTIFGIYLSGIIIVTYIFSYMNLGEFFIYSIIDFPSGLMGMLGSAFIFSSMVIVFNLMMDIMILGGTKNAEEY
ncbi:MULTISPECIES: hypothetical protein [Acidiplasma]|jgi:peptide/nickel transport system permease protein|uniref:Peptide ABC transporter permease n=2 Tax=Acidiplasma TaxID=507753 RepID=A0A0Q0XL92_9ARCH|nr:MULTISPECIES: hypothetical protein [Acidiplasma]KJE49048.1 hypothetical protein TZ01_07330 [Acidiplasma sp. MBA-1]KQB33621.1 hypothetical protein AOG54_01915 [Acidiplasma aeolicum]KQB36067.1 hypothetical protein AOG55_05150 [Acidiplasma cupricumulans]WMT54494.1 MAG: hypothetical protein RE470_06135 [Acidiplasma sp.]